jgi:hypothetical protein
MAEMSTSNNLNTPHTVENLNIIESVTINNNSILLKFNNEEYGLRSNYNGTPSLRINNIEVDPKSLIGRKVLDHRSFLGIRYEPVVVNNKINCIEYELYSYLLDTGDSDNGDLLNAKIIFKM